MSDRVRLNHTYVYRNLLRWEVRASVELCVMGEINDHRIEFAVAAVRAAARRTSSEFQNEKRNVLKTLFSFSCVSVGSQVCIQPR